MRGILVRRLFQVHSAQGLAEYALLAGLLAAGMIGAYAAFRDECEEVLRRILIAVGLPFPM